MACDIRPDEERSPSIKIRPLSTESDQGNFEPKLVLAGHQDDYNDFGPDYAAVHERVLDALSKAAGLGEDFRWVGYVHTGLSSGSAGMLQFFPDRAEDVRKIVHLFKSSYESHYGFKSQEMKPQRLGWWNTFYDSRQLSRKMEDAKLFAKMVGQTFYLPPDIQVTVTHIQPEALDLCWFAGGVHQKISILSWEEDARGDPCIIV